MSAPCPTYGFAISLRLAPGLDARASGALRDAFVAAVAARGLSAGGGAGDHTWHHVIARDGGQAIDADREALRAWAAARPELVEVSVGPLVDLDDPDA